MYLSGFTNRELEGIIWGLLDGDGERVLYDYHRRVILTTTSFIEAVQYEYMLRRVYGYTPFTRFNGYPRVYLRVIVTRKEFYDKFNEKFLDKVAKTNSFPYLVGLFYAEGWLEQRWLEYAEWVRTYIRDIRIRLKYTEGRATWRRLEEILKSLGIHYTKLVKRDKYEYVISETALIRRVLEYLPLNYKFFRYLWLQGVISFGIWIMCVALDYSVLPRIFVGCREGDCYMYLEEEEKRWLRKAGLVVPREVDIKSCIELYNIIGIGTYYDILDFVSRFVERNYSEWSEIREFYIDKIPRRYLRTVDRYLDYVLSGVRVEAIPKR